MCGDCNGIDLFFFCYEVRLQIWVQADDRYSYDVSAGIWVLHTGLKSGCKLVTLFGCNSYDGVSVGI